MKNTFSLLPAFALTLCLIVSACDKKPGPTPAPSPVVPTAFDGIFEADHVFTANGGFVTEIKVARAYFSSVPVSSINLPTGIEATEVRLNDRLLGKSSNTAEVLYIAQHDSLKLTPEKWSVAGKNAVPSFTYTDPAPRPSGITISGLPQTIDRSNGLTLDLSAVKNFEKGEIHLAKQGEPLLRYAIDKNTKSFSFPQSDLASFSDDKGYLMITLTNYSISNQGAKNFRFSKTVHLARQVNVVD